MSRFPAIWPDPEMHLRAVKPDHPVLYFRPDRLHAASRRFQTGFPGLVTYAVKANDDPAVIENLVGSGIQAFDVASPHEMDLVRSVLPSAVLHYNNPVRSRAEIAHAASLGVVSYSVDRASELEKLAEMMPAQGVEIAVRLKLSVTGAAYDFGSKFGADPETCGGLLQRVHALGYKPAMTFHPGTQCEDPAAWERYISAAAEVARRAGVPLARLNVGGGFPAHRGGDAPKLERIFNLIATSVACAFGHDAPQLVCEPGRAMVADAASLGVRVKALDGTRVYLNDGIYGGLQEASVMGAVARIRAIAPGGEERGGKARGWTVFGPTCDSLDRIKGQVALPGDIAEEDYLLIDGMGAYSSATNTRFNGYGAFETVTVGARSDHQQP